MKQRRKSHGRPVSSRPMDADLGQKEAALEKASKEELEHMGDAQAAAGSEAKAERALQIAGMSAYGT
jgi:hypothetical protein